MLEPPIQSPARYLYLLLHARGFYYLTHEESNPICCHFNTVEHGVDYTKNLSDLIYARPQLLEEYQQVSILYEPAAFVLTPLGVDLLGNEESWLSVALPLERDEVNYVATYTLREEDPRMVVGWQHQTYTFLKRTYPFASIDPYTVVALRQLIATCSSYRGRSLLLFIEERSLSLAVLHDGKLAFANRYPLLNSSQAVSARCEEILYYLAAVWQWLGSPIALPDLLYLGGAPTESLVDIHTVLSKALTPLGHKIALLPIDYSYAHYKR